MNWATIAPESRLYKGKNLFRWEVSPGLEHHCGTCATPLHNSRAKSTCIGKHVEPCYRFHQQLHFVGKSHECFGCNSSDEMHHNRHKEILRIIRQISAHDQTNTTLTIRTPLCDGGKARRSSATTASSNSITDTSSECPSSSTDWTLMTRRERKKAKKTGNAGIKDKRNNIESFPQEELDFVSEAIHLSVHESKGGWEGMYIYDHRPAPVKVEESIVGDEEEAIYEEIDDVTNSFHHLAVKAPGDLTPRQRKVVKKFSTPVGHTNFHGGSRKFSPSAPFNKDTFYDGVDPNIFFRLNVEITNPARNSKSRKDLVTKLGAAIKQDIEILDREEIESAVREEGFWRWAGKTVYQTIQETRRNFDWATGQKKGTPRYDPLLDNTDLEECEENLELQSEDNKVQSEADAESRATVDEFLLDSEQFYSEEKQVIEEAWETVGSKNNKTKKYLPLAKKLKAPRKSSPKITITEEDGAEDTHEMVKRHQQRLAGKSTITKSYTTPTRKPLGRLTLTIK